MGGNGFDCLSSEQKLRLTVQKDVRSICQEATHYVGMEMDTKAMDLIGELIWKKIHVFGSDLELFARHAKRSTINNDDVKLLVRRNPSLLDHITKMAEDTNSTNGKRTKDTKRKRHINPLSVVSNALNVGKIIQNPEPSTSNTTLTVRKETLEDSDSEDSDFVKMLQKRINDKDGMNDTCKNDVIDISD